MFPQKAMQQLCSSTRGRVVTRDHADYDEVRKLFNGMIDRRPAAILCCEDVQDVIAGVQVAREHGIEIAVRGGGHNVAGKSLVDDGLVIDLGPMKEISIDAGARTASAGPGLRLGELDAATHKYGMATPLGIVTDTGIAGLTLGGGIGWLNGRYGLACDNVLAFDLVTAEGNLLRASADEHPDLYWALRGGGGNFGVVTRFLYRLHLVETVVGGVVLFPFSEAAKVMRAYRDFAANSPDELTTAVALVPSPAGEPALALALCYCGDLDTGERVIETVRGFGPILAGQGRRMPFTAVQSMLDPAFPLGNRHYWKSSFATAIADELIDAVVESHKHQPSPLSVSYMFHMHGATTRVGRDATAFAYRDEQFDFMILAQWTEPAEDRANSDWARAFFDATQPYLKDAVYANGLGNDDDRVRACYGDNYDRLVEIKTKYDPTNFFHLNANIEPRSSAAQAGT